jgi:hypothetical protein
MILEHPDHCTLVIRSLFPALTDITGMVQQSNNPFPFPKRSGT